MIIEIKQNKSNTKERYSIIIEGIEKYYAETMLIRVMPESIIYDEANNLKYKIKKKWSFIKPKYEISDNYGNYYIITTKSILKLYQYCNIGSDKYELYGHKNGGVSIFKNGIQTAYFKIDDITYYDNDSYTMSADTDSDISLISAFVIIHDKIFHDSIKNTTVHNKPHLAGELRSIDLNWKSK